ncbi:hypothetical protein HPB48_003017 [Haemaphysalis longicornis]|uniref:Uncharacterized protein n=1 Tax=Haemaphysalis longicornis TaxID=44386 RepID=A0A9J6FE13_HAELO|nr:hypothetical protein HPB48_003017 [Haemaphysalis longicornis]
MNSKALCSSAYFCYQFGQHPRISTGILGAVVVCPLLYTRQDRHPLLNKNQVRFGPQNRGRSLHYQQHAYQRRFGSPGGAPFGRQHQPSGWVPQIPHRYPRTQFPGTLDHPDGGSKGWFPPGVTGGNSQEWSHDPSGGLVTQKEKDWLIMIQLPQVQPPQVQPQNPKVDAQYDGTDGDKLRFIPQKRVRTESKSYTPIQFQRSAGKLQAVSENYPLKILHMGVQRISEDEDRKVHPDGHLVWFWQLLLDIENMYSAILEQEDASCSPERKDE